MKRKCEKMKNEIQKFASNKVRKREDNVSADRCIMHFT